MRFEIIVSLRGNFLFRAEAESTQALQRARDVILAGLAGCGMGAHTILQYRRVEKSIVPIRWNPESGLFEEE